MPKLSPRIFLLKIKNSTCFPHIFSLIGEATCFNPKQAYRYICFSVLKFADLQPVSLCYLQCHWKRTGEKSWIHTLHLCFFKNTTALFSSRHWNIMIIFSNFLKKTKQIKNPIPQTQKPYHMYWTIGTNCIRTRCSQLLLKSIEVNMVQSIWRSSFMQRFSSKGRDCFGNPLKCINFIFLNIKILFYIVQKLWT